MAGVATTVLLPGSFAHAAEPLPEGSIYRLSALQYGEPFDFSQFEGQVLVVVNVASE